MKALFWHDWRVCGNRGIFWAVMIGNLVLAIAITSYAGGTAQANGFGLRQVHAITASLMAIWAPLFAYEPAAEAGSLALGNSGWSFEESAQRYSERAFRESGRPMAEYLLSRMLFALIPLAVSMMLLIGYLLAFGGLGWTDLVSLPLLTAYGSVAAVSCCITLIVMATTSTNLHSLVAMVYLTYIPMGLLTGVNTATMVWGWPQWLPFIVMLAVVAALFVIACIVIGRRYAETLRAM